MVFDLPLDIEAEVCIADNLEFEVSNNAVFFKAKGSSAWCIFPILCDRLWSIPSVSFGANFLCKDESMKTGISGVKRR